MEQSTKVVFSNEEAVPNDETLGLSTVAASGMGQISKPSRISDKSPAPETGASEVRPPNNSLDVLESLLNGLPDPLLVKDRNHRFLLMNDAMCALMGRSRAETLGRSDPDIVPEEQARAYWADDDEVFTTGREKEIEEQLTVADGSVRLLKTRKRAITVPGPNGPEPFLIVSILDITESRRAEMVLRESEERFRNLANGAPVMIWMSDPSGEGTFVNKLWLEVTGQTYEEALGYGWLKALHPDDRGRVEQIFISASAHQEPYQAEYRLRRADGSWAWVIDIGQPRFTADGTFQGYVGSALDITERQQAEAALRESEEHYRYSVDLNPQIPWIADAQGNILDISQRWCDLMGMSRDETLGQGWAKTLHPDDLEPTMRRWADALASGEAFDTEYRLRLADGNYRWFRARAAARRDDSGAIVRWYGSAEDIHDHKQAALALRAREQQLQTVFSQTVVGILHHDRNNRVLMVNQRYCEILGRSPDELDGISLAQFTHPEDIEWQAPLFQEHNQTGEPLQLEKRYVRPDGSVVWCNVNVSYVRDETGSIVGTITVAEDISARKLAEEHAREAHNLLQEVIDSVDDLIFVKDRSGRYAIANRKFGGTRVLGKNDHDLFPADLAEKYHRDDQRVLASGSKLSVEEYFADERNRRYVHTVKVPWRKNDETIGVIGISRDITARKEAEERLRWAAHHDELTALPNRRLFQEQIQKAFGEASRTQRRVGLLAMDVDHFKQINDKFGHDMGDAFLKGFAQRLCEVVGTRGMVARLGGDEFAVLLPDVGSENDVPSVANAILTHMREPLTLSGNVLDCRTSIGGTITIPEINITPDELRKQADLALYNSKAAGRSVFTMFRAAMREDSQKIASALEVAGQAVAFDWIVPFYQPKVDLESGALAGFEALLRWHHPRTGIQSPAAIAPAFDDTDLGIAIGERMRSCVLKHIRDWLDAGIETGRIAINASSAEFRRDNYAEQVLRELSRTGIPTSCLEVEVTEGVFLGYGSEFVERALRKLNAEGVTIALDDFGTGYASLSHLKQFPVNILKIDRSFVSDMETDASDAAVVKAVLSLGQNLGIRVVAEGIEMAEQAALLRNGRCDMGQGYYFSRPMPGSDVPRFISSWAGRKEY
ncbi:PAS domain S-box protein [Microvirga makkahensis]|uniref:PAS domain S-box protein n=1 Tax=Microvirga makkahensis TaxID=1128670 RepID=A0A7X3MXD7_9HYPH|nr:PAS domain S-box protein [Microvirga makkahensis]MXQ14803.1 PAS domain S-box protein [Microvirga makkahensis]